MAAILERQKLRCYKGGMTYRRDAITDMSNEELLSAIHLAAAGERTATATLIAVLAEFDARRLYLAEGCSSLFTYCTQVLHLSEHAAYGRIEAARLARRVPEVLDALREGHVTLTTVCLLGPHLTPANQHELLTAARHKSKRDVERLVAAMAPKPARGTGEDQARRDSAAARATKRACRIPPRSRRRPARGLGSRRRTLHVRGYERPMHGNRLPGALPPAAVRRRRRDDGRECLASLPRAQRFRGRAVVRAAPGAGGVEFRL